MKDIQGKHGEEDSKSIKDIEVCLGGDDPAIPTITQLNSTVDRSNEKKQGTEGESDYHQLEVLVGLRSPRSQNFALDTHELDALAVSSLAYGPVLVEPDEELDCEERVEGDSNHLNDDAPKHDVTAVFSSLMSICARSHPSSYCLNDKGDQVDATEDDCVKPWSEATVLGTKSLHQMAQSDEKSSRHEARGDDRRADLYEERGVQRWILARP